MQSTTLLRTVAGFVRQAAGRVLIDGAAIDDAAAEPPPRRHRLPELRAVPAHERGGERRLRPARRAAKRAPRIAARVGELLDIVQIGPLRDRRPAQLSGGQQQRVALARALAIEPSHPAARRALRRARPLLRLDMQIEIKRLQRQLGLTAILVTHDQDEAMSVADRIAVMRRGQIEQLGTPVEVYDRPPTLFVAGFIGTTNRLAGMVAAARTASAHACALAAGATLLPSRAGAASRAGAPCCCRCGRSSWCCRRSPATGASRRPRPRGAARRPDDPRGADWPTAPRSA